MKFGKILNKLTVALMATIFITISGLSSVCMAVRDNRNFDNIIQDLTDSSLLYSLTMLKSIPKEEGLKKFDQDGNYFKMNNLSSEEKEIYDKIVNQVKKIKDSVDKDDSSSLPEDCKMAKAIFFWVRNNIEYDKSSVHGYDENSRQKIINSDRKPQDALTTFKNKMGVCVGITRLTQLMMKIAGLPCLSALNYNHEFGVVWLDSLGGWALFDAMHTKEMREEEEKEAKEHGMSVDVISLCNNFPAVFDPENFKLQQANEYFITQTMFPDHFVYDVGDDSSGFDKKSLDFDGVSYEPSPLVLTLKSNSNSICVNEKVLQMNRYCNITGNITKIENFDVFAKKFVKVKVSESHVNETLKEDGFEFNLSCDGSKSRLKIKPSEGNVNCEEVEIPDKLVPFLADIDVFDVDSSIKTVRYDLLKTKDTLKKSAVPNGVKFEQTDLIS